jgi:hypothetical protein
MARSFKIDRKIHVHEAWLSITLKVETLTGLAATPPFRTPALCLVQAASEI